MTSSLLAVSSLTTWFPLGKGWAGKREWVRALNGVDLTLDRGEVLAVVGESGSGKSTLGRSVLRLVEPTAGTVHFDGIDVLGLGGREMRSLRKRMQIVFQDPYGALNPRMQIGRLIAEPLRLHRLVPEDEVLDRVISLLGRVGLEPYFANRFPHEMSGGQRQRIVIARALSMEPDLIVADEPVSALDVSVQAQILEILLDLKERDGIAMMFISHDLAVVERIADRVMVLYRGAVMEEAPVETLLEEPLHPYTQALLSAARAAGQKGAPDRVRLTGEPPPTTLELPGCPFASRCPIAVSECTTHAPILESHRPTHSVACHLVES
jgi:peptide/nickel transport system ATP-binding protein/oligopeptide transport system ATP-binding protein